MNWITKFIKPKIKSLFEKKSSKSEENLWTTCGCKNLIYKEDLQSNLKCCPKCGAHHKLSCKERFETFFDNKEYELIETPLPKDDPLKPIILMGYYNIIYQNGENNFLKNCKSSKVDGLIVVDLPWPENKKFSQKCKKKSINFVQLLSPTTSKDRMKKIIKESHDMVYYISMLSTTGGKLKVSPKKILKNYKKIKKLDSNKNLVIGFGITKKTISSLKKADGLVVGSQLCKTIADSIKKEHNPVKKLDKLVYSLKNKIL